MNRPVKIADLEAFPETHLFYPGSTLVRTARANQTPTRPGEEPNPAYVESILRTTATPSQLHDWYSARLTAEGYKATLYFRPSTQTSGWAWQIHHRLQVQIGVFDPALLSADMGIAVPLTPGTVVYEEVLVGYPPGLPRY